MANRLSEVLAVTRVIVPSSLIALVIKNYKPHPENERSSTKGFGLEFAMRVPVEKMRKAVY